MSESLSAARRQTIVREPQLGLRVVDLALRVLEEHEDHRVPKEHVAGEIEVRIEADERARVLRNGSGAPLIDEVNAPA